MLILPQGTYAQSALNLPAPGVMIAPSISYTPISISGITVFPENPLQFDFIIDSGDDTFQGEALKRESKKLINYFLAALTVPENEMWVNLSPYERDRIIANGLGDTEMGRDMLAQDYILKQLTASLMYPEEGIGSEFWKRVYAKTQAKFGTTEIPTNTFNKIWIVPDKATIYIHGNSIFVSESHLKVMLEEDYLAMESNLGNTEHGLGTLTKDDIEVICDEAKEAIREVLIPEIEKEVNVGKNFANLRQIFNSMILATWYKENLKENVLGKVYANSNKTNGIALEDKNVKEEIYNKYVEAFKRGVYNYIKEDYDEASQQIIPRRYFSGGEDFTEVEVQGARSESARRPVEERFADEGAEYTERVQLGMTDSSGEIVDTAPLSKGYDEAMLADWNWEKVELDKVSPEFDAWVHSGQIDSVDLKLLKEILSGDDKKVTALLSERNDKLFIKAEDKEEEDKNGRTVYLRLTKSFPAPGGDIKILRIKGARPKLADGSQSEVASHTGNGFVRNPVEVNKSGNPVIKNIDFSIETMSWEPLRMTPQGALLKDRADMEYRMMQEGQTDVAFDTDYPIATGLWKGLSHTGRPVGFVIAGMRAEDARIDIEDAIDVTRMVKNVATGELLQTNETIGRQVYEAIGRSLRAYHDKGDFHRFPHKGNWGVEIGPDSQVRVIMRDLDTTITRADIESKNVRRMEAAYRFFDLQRIASDLSSESLADWKVPQAEVNRRIRPMMESLLKGYFHDLDINSPEFTQLLEDAVSMEFAGMVRGLRNSDEKIRFSRNTPHSGRIWQHLYDISDNAMLTNPGGIDFNPNMLNLDSQGDSINIKIDNSMLQSIQPNSVQGMTPIIINITPITNYMSILGLSDSNKEDSSQVTLLQQPNSP